jgi:hypothetical protein
MQVCTEACLGDKVSSTQEINTYTKLHKKARNSNNHTAYLPFCCSAILHFPDPAVAVLACEKSPEISLCVTAFSLVKDIYKSNLTYLL